MKTTPSQPKNVLFPTKEEIKDTNMVAHLIDFVEHESRRDPREVVESDNRFLNCRKFYMAMKKEMLESALAEERGGIFKDIDTVKIEPLQIPHHSPYISGFNEGVNAVKIFIKMKSDDRKSRCTCGVRKGYEHADWCGEDREIITGITDQKL